MLHKLQHGYLFNLLVASGALIVAELSLTFPKSQQTDLHVPLLDVSVKNEQDMFPGFIFWAPYKTELPGPLIQDMNGVR